MKRNQHKYRNLAFKVFWFKKECEKCWKIEWIICVHHVDENPWNNEKDNLQILCDFCHKRLHLTGNKYCLWRKLSKEHKEKLRKASLWQKRTREDKLKMSINNPFKWKFWKEHSKSKKVNQYSLDWNFIKRWDSVADVFRESKISPWNISSCCLWKRNTAWWYIWKYL